MFLLHPTWRRTCKECTEWMFDETGNIREHGGAKCRNTTRQTPCGMCPKIPKGKPKERQYAVEPDDLTWSIYQHWRECRATGQFPDDDHVKRHAAILQEIHNEMQQAPMIQLSQMLLAKSMVGVEDRGT